ncbi:MAG: transposase [Leptospiraceae bacterium]|nr:transposase [Leptospiraceae bacterium]
MQLHRRSRKSILEFAVKYNTIRPHSSLGWISPLKFSKNKLNLIKK